MELSYRDERDKCYGATGMAIGVVVFDGEEMIHGIDLDADPHEMITYTADYFFSGNPGVSAKRSWNRILQNYNLAIGVTIANVLCRSMLLDHTVPGREVHDGLRDLARAEGQEECALEPDEADRMFDKNYSHLLRVFAHRGVQSVAHEFANALSASRRMSRLEMLEQLRALSML